LISKEVLESLTDLYRNDLDSMLELKIRKYLKREPHLFPVIFDHSEYIKQKNDDWSGKCWLAGAVFVMNAINLQADRDELNH